MGDADMTDEKIHTKMRARSGIRLRSVLLGLLILVTGIAVGAGSTALIIHRIVLNTVKHPELIPDKITERIKSKLDLTEDQAREINSIIKKRQKAIQAIRRHFQPKIEKELEETKEEIASRIPPDKAKQFRDRFEYLKRNWFPGLPTDAAESR